MKFIKMPFQLLWRIWFYVLVFCTLIILLPFFLILSSKESYYPSFWKLIRVWSYMIVYGMGFRLSIERKEELDRNKSYMFCPNHTSFMDGFILVILSKNPIVFVGKKELEKIPLFGFFYKKVVITVDRDNPNSRRQVYERAKKRLQNGTSVVIFPEGLVPKESVVLAPFKNGAFSLAIQQQIPIVPHVYFDCKRLFSWDVFKGRPGVLRVKQCDFISTEGFTFEDKNKLKEQTFSLIHTELIQDELYMEDTERPNNEKEFNSYL